MTAYSSGMPAYMQIGYADRLRKLLEEGAMEKAVTNLSRPKNTSAAKQSRYEAVEVGTLADVTRETKLTP